ncbi:hypothetical protein G9A89_000769 [Geosiphon pyriformis]|nr:hypothetical protein G9A89_000769 [Geosiphon pyriformis]
MVAGKLGRDALLETALIYTYGGYYTRKIINHQAKQNSIENFQIKYLQIIIITNHFHQQEQTESGRIRKYRRLNSNHYPAESAFNFYVNNKITECLEGTVNIKAARENFYTKLFQHTNLPRNYSFAPIIRKINQIIKRYTQQQFPIIYTNKDKKRIEFLPYPSYHHTPKSTINISSTGTSTSNTTSTFEQFPFQSKQKKAELLGPYVIVIDQLPINLIAEPIQQPLQLPSQQNQQPPQQPPQPPNLDPIVYVPIAKLDNFTGKEDDAQVWLNNVKKAITANRWNDARAMQVIFYFFKDTTNS